MKWIYSIKNKATAAAALLCLCVLVLVSIFNDRQHTKQVRNSIEMMYEDRLIAESYILTLTDCMHQLREALSNSVNGETDATHKVPAILATIEQTNRSYEKTKFTPAETKTYIEFKTLCQQINGGNKTSNLNKMQYAKDALGKLNTLSGIQIEESKSLMSKSEHLYNTGKSSSDFGIAIVIIIGLVLQALIFASKTLAKPDRSINPELN